MLSFFNYSVATSSLSLQVYALSSFATLKGLESTRAVGNLVNQCLCQSIK